MAPGNVSCRRPCRQRRVELHHCSNEAQHSVHQTWLNIQNQLTRFFFMTDKENEASKKRPHSPGGSRPAAQQVSPQIPTPVYGETGSRSTSERRITPLETNASDYERFTAIQRQLARVTLLYAAEEDAMIDQLIPMCTEWINLQSALNSAECDFSLSVAQFGLYLATEHAPLYAKAKWMHNAIAKAALLAFESHFRHGSPQI